MWMSQLQKKEEILKIDFEKFSILFLLAFEHITVYFKLRFNTFAWECFMRYVALKKTRIRQRVVCV